MLALSLGVGFAAAPAQADTLRVNSFALSGPDGNGHFTYTYTIDLTGPASLSATLTAGDQWAPDFLEVFDFAGFVPGSLVYTPAPAGPGVLANNSFTTQLVLGQDTAAENALLPSAKLVDSLNIDNLKMNYSGAGATNSGVAPLLVGYLSAKSIFGAIVPDFYLSTETITGGSGVNLSGTSVPTPEPGGIALALGLVAMTRVRTRRRDL